MNQHFPPPRREPTQVADGLPRWRWTLAEFDRFVELGILSDDDRVELIGGEIVPMAAKGIAHESVRNELDDWLRKHLPKDLRACVELGWRPDDGTYCEPDLIVFPRNFKPVSKAPAREISLLIEVADTTLKKDLGVKAAIYAALGVREYWVVNAFSLETTVHLEPTGGTWSRRRKLGPHRRLAATLVPEIALRLADLDNAGE